MGLKLKVDPENPEDPALRYAADFIRVGGLIVFPTDTLYGIGGSALSRRAIFEIYEIKKREEKKPIPLLVESIESLNLIVSDISPQAQMLIDKFWPGPLTLVFNSSHLLPDILTQERKTIAVRIPASKLCMSLLKLSGCPITATSANLAGEPTPKSVAEIENQLGFGIDLYLDAGELPETKPSTIVDMTSPIPKLLRAGAISLDRIKEIVPNITHNGS